MPRREPLTQWTQCLRAERHNGSIWFGDVSPIATTLLEPNFSREANCSASTKTEPAQHNAARWDSRLKKVD